MATEEQSMRDAIEGAIETIETGDGNYTVETEADEAQLTAEGLNNDEEGEKAKAEAKVEAEATEILGKEPELKDDPAADVDIGDGKTDEIDGDLDAAPRSWTPAAREEWSKLPESVRKQIATREHQIDIGLNEGAEHRKTGEKFAEIAGQYAQVIAAEGAKDPIHGFSELMKTVATLRMGSSEQKARTLAGFIKHYGIDINTLDGILAGQIGGQKETSGDPDMEAMINERMKPVNDLLAQMNANTRQQTYDSNVKAIEEVKAFGTDSKNEFYEDVKGDMADLVDMASKRDYKMPLQEAYDKACSLNPEIAKVLGKRTSDAALLNGKQTLAQKREAASSIMGTQGGAPAKSEDMSMRDALSEAWDTQTG